MEWFSGSKPFALAKGKVFSYLTIRKYICSVTHFVCSLDFRESFSFLPSSPLPTVGGVHEPLSYALIWARRSSAPSGNISYDPQVMYLGEQGQGTDTWVPGQLELRDRRLASPHKFSVPWQPNSKKYRRKWVGCYILVTYKQEMLFDKKKNREDLCGLGSLNKLWWQQRESLRRQMRQRRERKNCVRVRKWSCLGGMWRIMVPVHPGRAGMGAVWCHTSGSPMKGTGWVMELAEGSLQVCWSSGREQQLMGVIKESSSGAGTLRKGHL